MPGCWCIGSSTTDILDLFKVAARKGGNLFVYITKTKSRKLCNTYNT